MIVRPAYAISRFISHAVFTGVSSRRVLHKERAARSGPWLLAANHIAHFDPLLITSVVPRAIDWMAMADLFRSRLLGAWLRAADTFPVERFKADRAALRCAVDRLRAGRVVGMFPEGGLRDGPASVLGGAPLRRGIRVVAEQGGAVVVPCVILGSDRLYRAANWLPVRRVPVWIGFGEPLAPEGPVEERLAAAMRALAAEMRSHFALGDDDFPKAPRERMAER